MNTIFAPKLASREIAEGCSWGDITPEPLQLSDGVCYLIGHAPDMQLPMHTNYGEDGTPPERFPYIEFDVNDLLASKWQLRVRQAMGHAITRDFAVAPGITREAADVKSILRGRVTGESVQEELPWLTELYRGPIVELAQRFWDPSAVAAQGKYGVQLNIQRGTRMRFENHVDTNPLTGLLFLTDQPEGLGGELCVDRRKERGRQETTLVDLEANGILFRPVSGRLIFFDARAYPHYARALTNDKDTRVAAVMVFYTDTCPEFTRPKELVAHQASIYGTR